MKKTIATLVAVTVLSLGAAFAQEAKTETKAETKTTTNPVTGSKTATTEVKTESKDAATGAKKTSKKKHKKVTKKDGSVKSDTTTTKEAVTPAKDEVKK